MLFVSPFNNSKDQFTDISSNACELGTYTSGFVLLMARRLEFPTIALTMEQCLFIFQILAIAVQIITQLWNVVVLYEVVRGVIINTYFKDKFITKVHELYNIKKYANRWLYKVHKRHLKGWDFLQKQ